MVKKIFRTLLSFSTSKSQQKNAILSKLHNKWLYKICKVPFQMVPVASVPLVTPNELSHKLIETKQPKKCVQFPNLWWKHLILETYLKKKSKGSNDIDSL